MTDLLLLALGASLVNGHLLTEQPGLCPIAGVTGRFEVATLLSLATMFVVATAGPLAYALDAAVLVPLGLVPLAPLALVVLVTAAAATLDAVARARWPALHGLLGAFLPVVAANGALLGLALLPFVAGRTPVDSVAAAVPVAVAFGLAPVCLAGMRERLVAADVPAAFRGLPVALITAGLVVLALMGFGGILAR